MPKAKVTGKPRNRRHPGTAPAPTTNPGRGKKCSWWSGCRRGFVKMKLKDGTVRSVKHAACMGTGYRVR